MGRLFLSLVAGVVLVAAGQARPDPHYVRVSKNMGYYAIPYEACERLDELGYPHDGRLRDFNHRGYAIDLIAIRFRRDGIVASPPVYVYNSEPEHLWSLRLRSLIHGKTDQATVRKRIPRPFNEKRYRDGTRIWYYSIEVFDPFQERDWFRD